MTNAPTSNEDGQSQPNDKTMKDENASVSDAEAGPSRSIKCEKKETKPNIFSYLFGRYVALTAPIDLNAVIDLTSDDEEEEKFQPDAHSTFKQ